MWRWLRLNIFAGLVTASVVAEHVVQVSDQQPVTRGMITVATDLWPPFRMQDDDGLYGLDMDLLELVGKHAQLFFDVQRMPWRRALRELELGNIQMMVGLAHTAERAEYIHYLEPAYAYCRPAFYGLKGTGVAVQSYADLYEQPVGMVTGSAYFERFDDDEQLDKVAVASESQLLSMLLAQNLSLIIGTDCQMDYDIQLAGLAVQKMAWQPDASIGLYYGLSKKLKQQELADRLSLALSELLAEGQLESLQRRYR